MRSNSSNSNLQQILRSQYNINVDAEQFKDIYYGTVLQTDAMVSGLTPPPIQAGSLTLIIPSINPNTVWGPVPYPGNIAPPAGTQAIVSFDSRQNPVVLGFIGWSPAGVPGPQGAPGTNGTNGTAATIAVGTTTTGAQGTQASVNNSGSSSAAVFNFTVPQGYQGATGATGAQGAAGVSISGSAAALVGTYTNQPLITQFGSVSGTTNTSARLTVSFPATFPNGVFGVLFLNGNSATSATTVYELFPEGGTYTTSGFTVSAWVTVSGSAPVYRPSTSVSGTYLALGF
jgi:hypothetical protein